MIEKTKIKSEGGITSGSDKYLAQIIDLYRKIIPEELEQAYIDLAILLDNYLKHCMQIKHMNETKTKVTSTMPTDIKNMQEHREREGKITEQIKSLTDQLKENSSIELYEEIIKLASSAEQEHREIIILKSQIDEQQLSSDNLPDEANLQTQLEALESQITNQMNIIKNMHLMDPRLLNYKQLTEYIDSIEQIEVGPSEKEALKKRLSSFVRLRIAEFKTMDEFEAQLQKHFREHKPMDPEEETAEKYSFLTSLIALDSIHLGDSTFMSDLRILLDRNIRASDLAIDLFNKKTEAMSATAEYLYSGKIDVSYIDEMRLNGELPWYYHDIFHEMLERSNMMKRQKQEPIINTYVEKQNLNAREHDIKQKILDSIDEDLHRGYERWNDEQQSEGFHR